MLRLSVAPAASFSGPIGPLTATITHTRTGNARCDLTVGADSDGGSYTTVIDVPITSIGLLSRNVTAGYAYVFAYTD